MSDNYQVLATKYRPHRFANIVGQEVVLKTISNAFMLGRVAKVFLLTGVRGTGKTTIARLLARSINYQPVLPNSFSNGHEKKPFGEFDPKADGIHCARIIEGTHVDVREIDAATFTTVDDVKKLLEGMAYLPVEAPYKVYIIDEVHMFSPSAFNALLKSLEDTPSHIYFILATTELQSVPITVRSRCLHFALARVQENKIRDHLHHIIKCEGATSDEDSLRLIARLAEGSVRDALTMLDQVLAYCSNQVIYHDIIILLGRADRAKVFELTELIIEGQMSQSCALFRLLYDQGIEANFILQSLIEVIHLISCQKIGANNVIENNINSSAELEILKRVSKKFHFEQLSSFWQLAIKGIEQINSMGLGLEGGEMTVISLCNLMQMPTIKDLSYTYDQQLKSSDIQLAKDSNSLQDTGVVFKNDSTNTSMNTSLLKSKPLEKLDTKYNSIKNSSLDEKANIEIKSIDNLRELAAKCNRNDIENLIEFSFKPVTDKSSLGKYNLILEQEENCDEKQFNSLKDFVEKFVPGQVSLLKAKDILVSYKDDDINNLESENENYASGVKKDNLSSMINIKKLSARCQDKVIKGKITDLILKKMPGSQIID